MKFRSRKTPLNPCSWVNQRILRLPTVIRMTGYRYTAIHTQVAQGTFPLPISLGGQYIGWFESEIVAWINSRISASRGLTTTEKGESYVQS